MGGASASTRRGPDALARPSTPAATPNVGLRCKSAEDFRFPLEICCGIGGRLGAATPGARERDAVRLATRGAPRLNPAHRDHEGLLSCGLHPTAVSNGL